jgi:two-component system, response regulator / RNA-binding antiterminator
MLKVMLIDDKLPRRAALAQSLREHGYWVDEHDMFDLALTKRLATLAPDIIILDTDCPDRDTLEHIALMSRDTPLPVVMFTPDDDDRKIKQALRAGVTSYVVGHIGQERIKPVLQVAVARFEEHQALRQELASTKNQLAERKLIERAKGIVMQQKRISEEDAYGLLRKMAMDQKLKLAEVARQVVNVAEMLG